MPALTADRDTPRHGGASFGYPVKAGARLFAGGIACIDSTGFLVKGATSATLKAVGVAQEQVDNTSGVNGAAVAEVRRGVFRFANSASTDQLTNADIGNDCFIVDDQTVAKTNGSNTRSVAGKVRLVDTAGVWVEF